MSESTHPPCTSFSTAPARPRRSIRRRSWPPTRESSKRSASGPMTWCTTTHSTLPRFGARSAIASPVIHTLHLPPEGSVVDALRDASRAANVHPSSPPSRRAQADAWRRFVDIDIVLPVGVVTARVPWSATPGERRRLRRPLQLREGSRRCDRDRAARADVDRPVWRCLRRRLRRARGGCRERPVRCERSSRGAEGKRSGGSSPAPRWCSALRTGTSRSAWLPLRRRRAPPRWSRIGAVGSRTSSSTGSPASWSLPGILSAATAALGRVGELDRTACRRHAEAHLDIEAVLDAHERVYRGVLTSTLATAHG